MRDSLAKVLCTLVIFLGILITSNAAYAAETSNAPSEYDITVVNNSGKSDTVHVSDLTAGDTVKVYNAASAGKRLGYIKVGAGKTEATVTIAQIGSSAGSVYVSVTNKGMLESGRTKVDYDAEPQSDPIDDDYVTITNNVGKSDTVHITGLSGGDVVKVYNAASGGKALGSVSVPSSKTEATVTISQLGNGAGSVYVSVTSKGLLESERIKADYSAESKSDPIDDDCITITNNVGKSDTVHITGLSVGDVVRVYNAASGGKALGSVSVPSSKTEAAVTISQLGSGTGSVYVSVTSKGLLESERTKADYSAESKSDSIDDDCITVTNNVGKSDTVFITGLSAGDVVRVYNAASGGKLLGSVRVPSTKNEATVTISQVGSEAGSVYVSVTGKELAGKREDRGQFYIRN